MGLLKLLNKYNSKVIPSIPNSSLGVDVGSWWLAGGICMKIYFRAIGLFWATPVIYLLLQLHQALKLF